jgi:hypothetical protein
MKYNIIIKSANTVEEIENYWSNKDSIALLERFNYPDAAKADHNTLNELLLMAITDYEPNEAAAIVLDYILSDQLSEGQIHQISNDMLLDKIAEEYPEISLHAKLFHANQLLFKAFNGKFPNTKATVIECTITPANELKNEELTKEAMLVLLGAGLSDSNLIKRLFSEPMNGDKPFPEADYILWETDSTENHHFKIITSEYWLSKDDFTSHEFEGDYIKVEESEEV